MNFDWTKYRGNLGWLENNTILLTLAGSHSYGLNTDSSDYDWRGIAIPSKDYFTGWLNRFEQADVFDKIDCCIYDIRKFFALAANGNPNVLEILWTDMSELDCRTPFGISLRAIRYGFLSRKVRHTFSGYAIAQLKRIKTHRRWLLNPPTRKPERKEFDLPESKLLSADEIGAIDAVVNAKTAGEFSENVMHAYQRERAYHNALMQWQQYENWKKQRNPARASLEAANGYDTEHGMHLVRLMRMGVEILSTGEVIVKRPDREELLEIRGGAWSYDRIVSYAEEMDAKLGELEQTSSLPHSPNRAWLDGACQQIVEEFHGWQK